MCLTIENHNGGSNCRSSSTSSQYEPGTTGNSNDQIQKDQTHSRDREHLDQSPETAYERADTVAIHKHADRFTWPSPKCFSPGQYEIPHVPRHYQELNQQLEEIRLMRVLRTEANHEIECESAVHALVETPDYLALSYTWGRPDAQCSITLNGKRLPVRKNLLRFLQHIKHMPQYTGKWLWIDYVCIDQANDSERFHQVSLMSRIYSTAQKVLVWLGPAYMDSDRAMFALNKVDLRNRSRQVPRIWSTPDGAAIRSLCERVYWTRLWVVQEVVLARDVVLFCGMQQLPWLKFTRFLTSIRSNLPWSRGAENLTHKYTIEGRAAAMVHQIIQAGQNSSLVDQIYASRQLDCSDPRDRVYALLGIVKTGHEPILPDYTVGLPTLLNTVLKFDASFQDLRSLREIKRYCDSFTSSNRIEISALLDFDPANDDAASYATAQQLIPLVETESGLSIWWALYYQHTKIVDMWKAAHGKEDLDQAFVLAAAAGNLVVCQLLLKHEIIDTTYVVGKAMRTALSYASQNGEEAVVDLLLKLQTYKPAINFEESLPTSPLAMAVSYGHEKIARMLLDEFAKDSQTSLDNLRASIGYATRVAVESGLEVGTRLGVKLLKEYMDVSNEPPGYSKGSSPSMALCWAVFDKNESIVELLVDQSWINVNEIDLDGGTTPLATASKNGYHNIVACLLQRKDIDVNLEEPLYNAVDAGHTPVAKLLLARHDIDPNRCWQGLMTCLMAACRRGNVFILRLLLDRTDVDVNFRNPAGRTALRYALTTERIDIVRILLKDGRVVANTDETSTIMDWRRKGYLKDEDLPVGWLPNAEPTSLLERT